MDSSSQWVSKMCRLFFFADEYARRTVGRPQPHSYQTWNQRSNLSKMPFPSEPRIIEFLSEWLVTLLMPAKHVLETRSPQVRVSYCHHWVVCNWADTRTEGKHESPRMSLTPAVWQFSSACISSAIGSRVSTCNIHARRIRERLKLTVVPSRSCGSTIRGS